MQADDVKIILEYVADIPALIRQAQRELEELDEDYNCLHGIAMDGMPHSSTPGRVTERLAEKLGDDTARAVRIVQLCTLKANYARDFELVHQQIDALGVVAKRIVREHYIKGRKWEDVQTPQNWSVATKKRNGSAALAQLGQMLDGEPDAPGLLARARNARAI